MSHFMACFWDCTAQGCGQDSRGSEVPHFMHTLPLPFLLRGSQGDFLDWLGSFEYLLSKRCDFKSPAGDGRKNAYFLKKYLALEKTEQLQAHFKRPIGGGGCKALKCLVSKNFQGLFGFIFLEETDFCLMET